jgi:hypothetical protein
MAPTRRYVLPSLGGCRAHPLGLSGRRNRLESPLRRMRAVIAIICLGLFIWVAPASAQNAGVPKQEYSLTVTVHEEVRPRLTDRAVEKILEGTSDLLKRCNVTFKLKGSVGTFASAPAIIRSPADRDAVYAVKADVKVVKEIKSCNPDLPSPFNGCAFPFSMGRDSMIVTHTRAGTDRLRSILWAHEFGHRTGLQHRADPVAIMSGCQLEGFQESVAQRECRCFFLGPGSCPPRRPVDHPVCSDR